MGILIFTIFILASLIAANVLLSKESCGKPSKRLAVRLISSAGLTVILVCAWAASSVKIVDSTEVLVVRQLGKVVDTRFAGIQFVNPITQKAAVYSLKINQFDLNFSSYTKDAQEADIQLVVQYYIQSDKLMEIATTYGSQKALDERLPRIIEEKAKVALSGSSAMALIENRSELSPKVEKLIKDLEDIYYIKVSNVALIDIAFSDQFEAAVEKKMLTEQAKLQANQDKERAEIKAAEEKAVALITAEAQLETSKKHAESVKVEAEGEAAAQKVRQNAWDEISPEVRDIMLKQLYLETWNGQLPKVGLSDGNDIIMDIGGLSE